MKSEINVIADDSTSKSKDAGVVCAYNHVHTLYINNSHKFQILGCDCVFAANSDATDLFWEGRFINLPRYCKHFRPASKRAVSRQLTGVIRPEPVETIIEPFR
jgi:hypothetical protein